MTVAATAIAQAIDAEPLTASGHGPTPPRVIHPQKSEPEVPASRADQIIIPRPE